MELVGCVEEGIGTAEWSPDLEFLAVITADSQKLLLLTNDFDVLLTADVDCSQFGQGICSKNEYK